MEEEDTSCIESFMEEEDTSCIESFMEEEDTAPNARIKRPITM